MSRLVAFLRTPEDRPAAPGWPCGARCTGGTRISSRVPPLLILGTCIIGLTTAFADKPTRGPDIVRTTVQIRNGDRSGSGTIVASIPDETWILTAAHVVHRAADVKVELHRFNFGSRLTALTEGGGWPRLVSARVAASDPDADVSLLRIKGMVALPFVARLDPEAGEPKPGELLTSVGIDRGLHLTTWQTTSEGALMIDLGKGGGPKPFTVTSRPPEHGRSGGGLFRTDGAVIGVCTGFFVSKPGERHGAFAAMESIRRILRAQGLDKLVKRPPGKSS